MINQKSIRLIEKANFSSHFKKPLYQSYNFSNIPSFIIDYFLGKSDSLMPKEVLKDKIKEFNQIIFFLIDGFGWRFFEEFNNHQFFKFIKKYSCISKLTSQFPSTTAAHITNIHTGLKGGESGVYEWNYYEPKIDAVISPLLFSFAGDKKRETLKNVIAPKKLFPKQSFYQKLKKLKIKSFVFQHREYTPSTFSDIVFRGANVFGYKTLTEAIINLLDFASQKSKEKRYFFLYFDKIDSISHQYGPASKQTKGEILTFLEILTKIFLPDFFKLNNTLFMMTADHGQVEINPKKTIYLNLALPQIKNWLMKNKKEELIVPEGSPRDFFLHVKKDSLLQAKEKLEKLLKDKAEVYLTENLIKRGVFGEKISPSFRKKVGNLVILPFKGESVWWFEKDRFENKFFGHHGGLTPEEMEIPFLVLNSF